MQFPLLALPFTALKIQQIITISTTTITITISAITVITANID